MNRYLQNAAALTAGLLATLALAAPADAQDPSASATGTVAVGIRSITVSPTTFTFDSCVSDAGTVTGDKLTFPNGRCLNIADDQRLTLTNGDAGAHIYVRATDFVGDAGGPPWELCEGSGTGADCAGGEHRPGVDEAWLSMGDSILNDDRCDTNWDQDNPEPAEQCFAAPGQIIESLGIALTGPSSTSNLSPSFSTTVTWTALP